MRSAASTVRLAASSVRRSALASVRCAATAVRVAVSLVRSAASAVRVAASSVWRSWMASAGMISLSGVREHMYRTLLRAAGSCLIRLSLSRALRSWRLVPQGTRPARRGGRTHDPRRVRAIGPARVRWRRVRQSYLADVLDPEEVEETAIAKIDRPAQLLAKTLGAPSQGVGFLYRTQVNADAAYTCNNCIPV